MGGGALTEEGTEVECDTGDAEEEEDAEEEGEVDVEAVAGCDCVLASGRVGGEEGLADAGSGFGFWLDNDLVGVSGASSRGWMRGLRG